ncbi:uncharacterized protein LOC100559992 [Anolis carolinensis]|uniref:uncharacterized protein LOC100559992 n=1 Tax=Anolis carolinensis TaxID=28377 RepID=UPI0002039A60|nr:PREDICTED: uncharacterized protein LOC100559992 [Anolis carolinensis]XP_016850023.1 PREDICTED: uncharacterized protein LOC100559992 [Anolis carolinensis]|eukprot:XP_003222576.1 PREDICTED: uncharacterized protein LOC100559992 [Anolis carolinensis]
MSKTENTFIVNILEELDKDSMEKFLNFLNVTGIDRNTIPKAKLEGASVMKVVELLVSYYHPRHLEVLRKALLDVPENQLADKVSTAIDSAKKKRENQTEEIDDIPTKKAKYSGVPKYKGEYRLSDMEKYATENQDLLIEILEKYMEPSAFKALKEELAMRKLKSVFSFKAAHFHSLITNQKLKKFLSKDGENPSPKMLSKILDSLFFPCQSNKKNTALNQPREKRPITSSPDSTGEQKLGNEREKLATDKVKGNAQISNKGIFIKNDNFYAAEQEPEVKTKESQLKDEKNEGEGDERKEFPENKQKGDPQISKENTFNEEPDVDCNGEGDEKKEEQRNFMKMEPVEESKKDTIGYNKRTKKEVPENEPYENLTRAIRKHYEGKKVLYQIWDNIEHKIYKCFIAQDVILFKLEEETDYRILRNLQDAKDLNKNGLPKNNVEFELQFNMAVLGVQYSECISINNLKRVKANSFRKHEEDFENIVSEIVLPVLALYKRVKLNTYFAESLEQKSK